jgi:hypothetical protein
MIRTTPMSSKPMPDAITLARVCHTGLAGLFLAILSASLAEATYGPKTVVGEHYQQTSGSMSANGINEGSCGSSNHCYVLFQPVPQQKALIVQHVSCYAYASAGVLRYGYLGGQKQGTFLLRRKHLVPVHTSGSEWVVNSPVTYLVKPGDRPHVHLRNTTNSPLWLVECDISGQLQ